MNSNTRPVADPRPAFVENPEQADQQQALGRRIITDGIRTVFLVGCGGSLAAYGPSVYTLDNRVPQLVVQAMNSDEFNYRKPAGLGPTSIVLVGSHTGTTAETVRAIDTAKAAGAESVVSLTSDPESPLATHADLAFTDRPTKWAWDPKEIAMARITQGILDAAGLAPSGFDEALAALPVDIPTVFADLDPALHRIAEDLATKPITYALGSGPMEGMARAFAMFYMQEMLWRHAAAYNAGEFLHGPFEMTEPQTPYLVLCGEDATRPMTDRALGFLNRYSEHVHVIDSREFRLAGVPDGVRAEIAPIVMSAVTTRLAQHLEAVLDHDLSTRRYMFSVEY